LTLEVAVTIRLEANVSYADAIAAATDPSAWDVASSTAYTVAGFPATLVEATSTDASSGVPVGSTRYAYFLDIGANGTAVIGTTGTAGDAFDANTATVDLIASQSTVSAPS